MSLEKHVIELAVKDAVSEAFRKVGLNAENAGKKVEEAGKKGTRSAKDWSDAAGKVGLALGAVGAIAIKLGNESEAVQARLEQSIENTGEAYGDLEQAIGKAADRALDLAFDDEDALNAIAKLTDATGSATEAIDGLAIAQDIARARGISLASATDVVVKASLGQYGALKRVGIVIDENATKEEALALLQAKYAGQAEAYAGTNAATWDKVGNTIENKLEALGGALADFQLPLLAIGSAAGAIGPLGDAFEGLGGKAMLAQKGAAALSLAMGPVGIVAAAGLAAGALAFLWTQQEANTHSTGELTDMFEANTQSILDNAAAYERLGLFTSAMAAESGLAVFIADAEKAQSTLDNISGAMTEVANEMGGLLPASGFEWLSEADAQWIDSVYGNGDAMLDLAELTAAQVDFNGALRLTADEASKVDAAFDQAMSWARDPNYAGADILADINAILNNPELTGAEVVAAFDAIIGKQEEYNIVARRSKEATDALMHSTAASDAERHASVPVITASTGALKENADALGDNDEATANTTKKIAGLSEELYGGVTALTALDKYVGTTTASWSDFDGATVQSTKTLEQLATESAALDTQLAALATTLQTDFAGAAGAAYNRSVGFTDSIVSSIQTTKDWTDAMTGVMGTDFMDDGTWSKLSQMVADGTLDQEDYTEALKAQEDIYADLTRAQDASAEIQIKQADAMAEGTKASADYLENIAGMDEAAQGLALAWADTDIAGQAMEVAGLAGEYGNMDAAQQAAFESMVTSAAATNPALAAVLSDLGLIKESTTDPTGWTLAIDESAATASLQTVSDGIGAMIEVLAVAYNLDVDAILNDSDFWADYNNIPTDKYTTVHFVGVREGIGWDSGGYALGGVIPFEAAALGRVSGGAMTLVGEHGPELVNLPGGSLVTPNHATMYRNEAKGGGGGVNIYGNITVVANDPQSFIRQLRQSATTLERR